MNRTDSEYPIIRVKWTTLLDKLCAAGFKSNPRLPMPKKLQNYLLDFTQAKTVADISTEQFEKFFWHTEIYCDDLSALIQRINSIQPSLTPQAPQSFSASDLEILKDAGISSLPDSRDWIRYWK